MLMVKIRRRLDGNIPSKQPHIKYHAQTVLLFRFIISIRGVYNAKSRIHWKKIIFAKIKIINVSKKIKSC